MVGSQGLMRRSNGLKAMLALPLLAGLLAGCGSKANNDTFDLSASGIGNGPSQRSHQILVPEPTALKALGSEQVVVRVSPSEIQYLANSQWSDTLPRMVQSKLIEAYENSGKLAGVGKPGQGLAIDYQVVTDIRTFEISTSGQKVANVEIFAKLLNDRNGTVKAQKVFSASVPVSGTTPDVFVKGMDRAFAQVSAAIVDWTLKAL